MTNRLFIFAVEKTLRGSLRRGGFALIIVLALVALVTILIVAFLSRANSQSVVSSASASAVSTEVFARAAIETLVTDLRSEIISGSTPPANTNQPVYFPQLPANAMPSRVGSSDDLPNLIKRSLSAAAFDGRNGLQRASAISTGTASVDGHKFSPERWNAPRLMASGASPLAPPVSFQVPDWIYVTRNGQNPQGTALNAVNRSKGSDPILGRFAYTIYDEGGLLDANVAGYPAAVPATEVAKKGYLAMADLTKVGLTAAEVSQLINWRNAGSGTNGNGFVRALASEPSGFRNVMEGDRAFVGRRQLLQFFKSKQLNPEALPFLGTFSRGLNQPLFGASGPVIPGTPAVIPVETSSGGYTLLSYSGNNDAAGVQAEINPRLLDVRVTTAFDRFTPLLTGSIQNAKVGDPLLVRRFPLDRLAWLTCKGPIAPNGILSTDPDVAPTLAALRAAGFTDLFLKLGTAANIMRAFGLEWTADPSGSSGNVWVYDHGVNSRTVGRLSDAASAAREPDFLELLKASIHVGSLGKGAASNTRSGRWIQARDIRTDFHLIQIFANIIDQYDTDGFPTEIAFPRRFLDSELLGLHKRKVRGIENLPYIFGSRTGAIMVRAPNPAIPNSRVQSPPPGGWSSSLKNEPNDLRDEGLGVLLYHSRIWNPHFPQCSLGNPRPTNFRLLTFSGGPDYTTISSPLTYLDLSAVPWGGDNKAPTRRLTASGGLPQINADTTELLFEVPGTGFFQQPTVMALPGIPANTNLRTGAAHSLRSISGSDSAGSVANASVDAGGTRYLGALLATFPILFWDADRSIDPKVPSPPPGTNYLATTALVNSTFQSSKAGQSLTGTTLLQYRQGTNWITYDVKATTADYLETWIHPNLKPTNILEPGAQASGVSRYTEWSDPRTMRFGSPWAQTTRALLNGADATIQTSRPDAAIGLNLTWHIPGMGFPTAVPLTSIGWIAKAPAGQQGNGAYYPQLLAENDPAGVNAYRDADNTVRRGMAAYSPANSLVGKPLATDAVEGRASRPIMLNRPFLSVADLGSVFRDLPWKQLDFFTPESGDSALLESFCIKEDQTTDAILAGKLNLNTRNANVLQAVLDGARRDEFAAADSLGNTESRALAEALTTWTKSAASNEGPLTALGDLVGRYNANSTYSAFYRNLTTPYSGTAGGRNNVLARFRETDLRALAQVGEVRVWNLFIDLVSQVGIFTPNAADLAGFQPRGETRWWIHLALDRATGRIIDQQIEVVPE